MKATNTGKQQIQFVFNLKCRKSMELLNSFALFDSFSKIHFYAPFIDSFFFVLYCNNH